MTVDLKLAKVAERLAANARVTLETTPGARRLGRRAPHGGGDGRPQRRPGHRGRSCRAFPPKSSRAWRRTSRWARVKADVGEDGAELHLRVGRAWRARSRSSETRKFFVEQMEAKLGQQGGGCRRAAAGRRPQGVLQEAGRRPVRVVEAVRSLRAGVPIHIDEVGGTSAEIDWRPTDPMDAEGSRPD